jgi:hypothetical protein
MVDAQSINLVSAQGEVKRTPTVPFRLGFLARIAASLVNIGGVPRKPVKANVGTHRVPQTSEIETIGFHGLSL